MKPGRIFAFMLVLAITLILAGCKRSYFFSFKAEQRPCKQQRGMVCVGEEDDEYFFQAEGANFRIHASRAPKRFSGDFTMTVKFRLFADLTHRYSFGVALSDGYFYER